MPRTRLLVATLNFTVVGLQQLVVAFHNVDPTLQHLCRAEEVEWPCLAEPPVESRPSSSLSCGIVLQLLG